MLKIVLSLLSFVLLSEAVSQKCMTNSDCGMNQCCNNYHGPLIMSKRDVLPLLSKQILPQEGVCENYLPEGSHCNSIATMNGHCGCNVLEGLTCHFFPASTTTLPSIVHILKKSMLPPWMGTSKCAKKTLSIPTNV